MKVTQHRSGLTLIELMVALTIFAVVTALTFAIFFRAQSIQQRFDRSYALREDINHITSRIENALRSTREIINGTETGIICIDVNFDTFSVLIKEDTLFINRNPTAGISVKSLHFEYVSIVHGKEIRDFSVLDIWRDGVLDSLETKNITGIGCYCEFLDNSHGDKTGRTITREFFVRLRNVPSSR